MSSDKDVLRDFTLLVFLDNFQSSIAADQQMDGWTDTRESIGQMDGRVHKAIEGAKCYELSE